MALSLRVEFSVYGAVFKFSVCAAHTLIGRYATVSISSATYLLLFLDVFMWITLSCSIFFHLLIQSREQSCLKEAKSYQ
ncbi:hypothetical protein EM53_002575 [Vibrio parahaemolyticus]|nr:hypothetical protein EM53_002575 [Vibrio parahaemolyticus]